MKAVFPDLAPSCAFSVFIDDTLCDLQEPLHALVSKGFLELTVDWNSFRPLAATKISITTHGHEPGSLNFADLIKGSDCTERWIRSPFRVKPVVLKVPFDMTLSELANAFVSHTQLNCTMIVQAGARVLDPLTSFQDIETQEVVSFRMTGLPGGVKGGGDVKARLRKCLAEHGVPASELDERLAGFLSKCAVEELLPLPGDEGELWDLLKRRADEKHVRLVQHAELRAFRKSEKGIKPPSRAKGQGKNGGKTAGKVGDRFVRAEDVVVNPKHFWAGDRNVEILPVSRFAPDMEGLTVVGAKQAQKFADVDSMSTSPLAMLVIDKDLSAYSEILTVPAHDRAGSPVVVKAALVQCGGETIVFKPAILSVDVSTIDATTVEFIISRDLVANWADAASPLNYLGTHVPALRGNALLATWSIKTFDGSRKVVSFQKATEYHGFFKVNNSILEAILARSGKAGVFFSPKTPEKRFDPKYPVVPLPSLKFQEVVAKCNNCEKALGITRSGEHFGIRCRRSDLVIVRQFLFPETTFVDAGDIQDGMDLFVLRKLPVQVGKDELTQALAKSGWDAAAIRPQGDNNWLLGSRTPPPSSHICLNQTLVIIEPLRKDGVPTSTISVVASEHMVQTVVEPSGNAVTTSTTRIQEVRQELQAQLQAEMDQRLACAQEKIEGWQAALEKYQVENDKSRKEVACELAGLKEEQAFVRAKIGDVESCVQNQASGIVSEVSALMQQMQQNLQQSFTSKFTDLEAKMEGDSKRAKLDPFATKSG